MYENIPYLTILLNKKSEKTIVCLIQLLSKSYISYYDINELTSEDYEPFFNLSNIWFKRCPLIPISLYYRDVFKKFNYCRHNLETGTFQIIGGFSGMNLKYLCEKRIKRKIIHLETQDLP